MENKKDSFILYEEYYEPIKMLSTQDKGLLLAALYEYHMTGDVIDLPPMARVIFQFIRQRMDFNSQKYNDRCKQNSENIKKRWNKENTNEYDRIRLNTNKNVRIQKNTKHTDIDMDMDMYINTPPTPPPVDNLAENRKGDLEKNKMVYVAEDYHVAWDEQFQDDIRSLTESQIGEIDYWVHKNFIHQEIPARIIRNALATKARRELVG